ncbi:NDP-hexose 2,3-dehydratase family protein [Streptomyces sp. NPDC102283]|uniref:NDP-hexose 2,3-dehydratase family protein n=1 Tax=Streptomyces sp. NPDC102283 TaxID=3366155 RepID=UPI0037F58C0A
MTVTRTARLVPRTDAALPGRLARSAAATEGWMMGTPQVSAWLAERAGAHPFQVTPVPFAALDAWSFEAGTGNLVHSSGRFFTIEGQHAVASEPEPRAWHQPVINQPEVGILGLLAREFGGVLHFLLQAKMEPGNPNLLQLSPTVQATRSNYTGAHQGAPVRYLDHFVEPSGSGVIADVLQSEHGSWFHRKSNRNMIVETTRDVPLHPDFCWLTLGQIAELLHRDLTVNMDTRTVLSCLPGGSPADGGALHSDAALLSWITDERCRHDVTAERVPLAGLPGWRTGERVVGRPDGRFFRVVAVSVRAGSREVGSWTQPLIEPVGVGVTAFLRRTIEGRPHVLVHARAEGGFRETVELGPTVQCTPGNYGPPGTEGRPPFLDLVLAAGTDAGRGRIRYEALHSEEGGRFLNATSRYLVVDTDEVPPDPPRGYRWVTPEQLSALAGHRHYVNVQARTLLACLNAMGAAG